MRRLGIDTDDDFKGLGEARNITRLGLGKKRLHFACRPGGLLLRRWQEPHLLFRKHVGKDLVEFGRVDREAQHNRLPHAGGHMPEQLVGQILGHIAPVNQGAPDTVYGFSHRHEIAEHGPRNDGPHVCQQRLDDARLLDRGEGGNNFSRHIRPLGDRLAVRGRFRMDDVDQVLRRQDGRVEKNGRGNVDLVIGENLDQLARRAVERRKPAGDLLPHIRFNLMDEAGQDLVDKRRDFWRKFAFAFKQQSGDAIKERVSCETRSILCQ